MAKRKIWHDNYKNMGQLSEGGNENKSRFIDEINIIKKNCNAIKSIITIVNFSVKEYWYMMPIAQTGLNYINENKIEIIDIVEYVIQLCEILQLLHGKQIAHRDLKPSNIYFYQDRFYFADFGLVEFPDNTNNFTSLIRVLVQFSLLLLR